ncbi:hypothetical protein SAMD00019534_122090 [Acytostelium subglobosum LB1]|uniref:hypothetical protein n=1 Tax=Acytostelium subglobosum LB1 TaxID=1410327 RepID=UPI0006447C38|nr:hypothetical protein SAMD00019534_122090 [Acytostelium subglobosum LB1]GAM29033.1 hypothetical protein SAMD00019534_122090 [Acytostelium subglobosum LB1]|eukprot:XP_012748039.1 hypothetical protein SAMD00019534_122090 [Acytostelium subglobosum LB1]
MLSKACFNTTSWIARGGIRLVSTTASSSIKGVVPHLAFGSYHFTTTTTTTTTVLARASTHNKHINNSSSNHCGSFNTLYYIDLSRAKNSRRSLSTVSPSSPLLKSVGSGQIDVAPQQHPVDNDQPDKSVENQQPTWVDKCPQSIQPYLRLSRLDKPIGTLLLLYPCWFSTAFAAAPGTLPDIKLMVMFATGAILMRSAGCVINDMADYKFDRMVERTRSRPLASMKLTHKKALALLAFQLGVSFCVLLTFNPYTILLSLASVPIVIVYPFMKRFTYYPQLVLGFAFNWGALVGYSAVQGYCDWSICLPLYVAGIAWTLVYDTIYAHMDKKDDVKIGVKSTAQAFGENSRVILSAFSALTIGALNMAGMAASMPWIYYVGTTIGALHLAWQMKTVDFHDPRSCLRMFISNRTFALIILLTIIISRYFMDVVTVTLD